MKNFQTKSQTILPTMKFMDKNIKPLNFPTNFDPTRSRNILKTPLSPYSNRIDKGFLSSVNSREKTPIFKSGTDQEKYTIKELHKEKFGIDRHKSNGNMTPLNTHNKLPIFSPREKSNLNTISAPTSVNSSREGKETVKI